MQRDEIIFCILLYVILDVLKGVLRKSVFHTLLRRVRDYAELTVTTIDNIFEY